MTLSLRQSHRALGLMPGASLVEVRKAYRSLALKMHPDVDPRPESVEKFKSITAAYNHLVAHLSNKAQAKASPKASPRPASRPAPQPAPEPSKTEAPRAQRTRSTKDREAARARWRQQAASWKAARAARVAAEAAEKAARAARAAEAAAQRSHEPIPAAPVPPPEVGADTQSWWSRLASGRRGRTLDISRRLPVRAEHVRHGGSIHFAMRRRVMTADGQREVRETLRVQVPPGARRGDKIRLEGKGHEGPHGAGDLFLVLDPAPLTGFERMDADLHSRARVPQATLSEGGIVEAQGVDGQIKVRLPAGSRPGTRLRLRGQGLPTWGGDDRGDLILTLQAMGA
ncbi:MAG: DnaJ C-terminal domain-containing protein [Bradymonadia bacterium]